MLGKIKDKEHAKISHFAKGFLMTRLIYHKIFLTGWDILINIDKDMKYRDL